MKLWETQHTGSTAVKALVESFTVGKDFLTDQHLLPWDCYASAAHAHGLAKIGILSEAELAALLKGLTQILESSLKGEFKILAEQEDCHTAIEDFLVKNCGEVGKKIHAGRSRNDQALTAIKLLMKSEGFTIAELCSELAQVLAKLGAANTVPMPGYTHMQKAMPSSVPLWASAYSTMLLDSVAYLNAALDVIDCSPLGSAAGYGVTLPLDREFTASLLGFAGVQTNVVAAQSSRGKNEAAVVSALSLVMFDLGKLCADLLFFSQAEIGYMSLPAEFCTGSSIMPQKKNPDVLELMRAKAKVVSSLHSQILSISTDLPSGYNRDMQLTKEPLIEALGITKNSLALMTALVPKIQIHAERCRAAMTEELYAADAANELVSKGTAFRDAYRTVKEKLLKGESLELNTKKDRHLAIEPTLEARCMHLHSTAKARRLKLQEVLHTLLKIGQ